MEKIKRKVTLRKAFKDFIWPRRYIVLAGLVLIIISRVAGLVLPGASKYLIDNVIVNADMEMLKLLLAITGGAILIQATTSFVLTRLLSVEAQRLISILRTKVQKQILSLPVSFFDNNKSGNLVSRIMSDVEGVRNLVGTGLVQLFGGILTSVLSLILMINISPVMTLYVLAPISIFGFVALKAFGYIRPIFRKRREITADVTGRLTETLNGVKVIKGFNAEEQENKTFEEGVEKLFQNVKKSLTSTALMTSSSTFLLGLATLGIMGIGGWQIVSGDLTIGEFLSFTLYLGFMIAPIAQMGNIGSQLTEALAGLDRTEEIMNLKPEDDPYSRPIILNNITGRIEFDNVSFAYEEGKDVIRNITFTADPGKVTALVGTTGSGKTTIANLAASFLDCSSGIIKVDDIDLRKVSLSSYRKNLGVVLQDDFLFEGTIKENILFPRPFSSNEELEHAVKAAYVNEFTDRFEKGLETLIGERGVKLSGGQRQRIAIARAILADPKILLLDEATSNLDAESENYIQKSLYQLMKGRTTLVIAHRLSTIKKADQILVIEKGRIEEKGTHDELIKRRGRYFELYTYQARI